MNRAKLITGIILILVIGLFFRLYHIEFGLPHSLHADEPEFGEFAVKYTYEIKSIIKNNDWYKLIPLNFVYGTFPIYLFAAATMTFSKVLGALRIGFDKMHIYIFLRSMNALFAMLMIPAGGILYYKLFKDKIGALVAMLLLAANWELVVLAHYLNADIITATLLSISFLTVYLYSEKSSDTLYTLLTGILLGLAIGTKITSAAAIPLYLYIFITKKDLRGLFAFLFVAFGAFAASNPFSLIFADRFAYRILMLFTKENGLVFDSVDSNLFKYILALAYITTPIILAVSLYGKFVVMKEKKNYSFHLFLIGQVLLYVLFYSLGSRRVDRWLLPILPIIMIYASFGIRHLKEGVSKPAFAILALFTLATYTYFPLHLLSQFQRQTPKSAAYLWMRDNTKAWEGKYVITEQGLDPMNKLPSATVKQIPVYRNENAQFFYPESPRGYNYIVLSSRPMTNFKRPEVEKIFPEYTRRWQAFENELADTKHYKLIKAFELPKPNLVPLSDVYIYKNIAL